jgi:hypothetical protein
MWGVPLPRLILPFFSSILRPQKRGRQVSRERSVEVMDCGSWLSPSPRSRIGVIPFFRTVLQASASQSYQ